MHTTIAIENDGSINSTSAAIQRIGNIYTLTGNIVNETISIQKDNIILNGGGYTLEGFGTGFVYAYEAIDLQNVTNVTVENFNLDSFWQPIQAHDSLNLQIKANNLTNCPSYAISFDSCNNSVIAGNNLEGTIYITNIYGDGESTNNIIIGNTISDVAEGIQISESSHNVISDNILTNVYDNIGVDGNSSVISNNIIINGIEGIFAGGDTAIFGNTIDTMTDIGLGVSGQNDKIYENTVENAKYGVSLQTSNESGTTIVYHNNFINDTQNLQFDQSTGTVLWDNGKEGNYWSSYNGTSRNGDGIGDTPYNLGGNNIDLYPLMQPYVPQSAIVDYSMGRLFFTLAIIVAAAGAVTLLCLYLKFKTHR
jgi:parallel beta-helix repeat protein